MCFIRLHLVFVSAHVKLVILQHIIKYCIELNLKPSDLPQISIEQMFIHMSLNIILVSNCLSTCKFYCSLPSLSSEINELNLNFYIFRKCAFSEINVVKIKMLLLMLYCYFFLYQTYFIIINRLFSFLL